MTVNLKPNPMPVDFYWSALISFPISYK